MAYKTSLPTGAIRRAIFVLAFVCAVTSCGAEDGLGVAVDARTPTIDMTAWRYNADDNVYHQIGIPYCAKPTDAALQTIAIFVPGAYFKGVASGDGTYVCTINKSGAVAGFRSENAPIAYPVDTPGCMSQRALTEYASFREFTDAGFVYAHVGRRGRNEGAPRGVVDLKGGRSLSERERVGVALRR